MREPARLDLARTPTPLVHLERTSRALGVELWIKRDDLTGIELSGNKVRKLEYLFAEARAQDADVVLTCGGEQSNHCRATALAAARLGLGSRLFLRTADPAAPPATTGNILLDRLAGAELVWISHAAYGRRAALMAEHAAALRAAGRRPYVIPEGGSNATGSWGYVRAAHELDRDLAALPAAARTTVIYAAGSGGTGAGLVAGAAALGWRTRGLAVAGVNVCDDRAYFVLAIKTITDELAGRDGGPTIPEAEIEIVDGYVGLGYARSRPEELAELVAVARREAVLLDPVYTGKAFFGMVSELRKDRRRFGDRIVFLHTGGLFGLFPIARELGALVE